MYAYDLENEWELEDEWEDEGEEFIGDVLGRLFPSGTRRRKVALAAAKSALKGGLGAVGSGLGALLPDKEFEFEDEWEDEFELRDADDTEALMEHLGDAACRAQSEAEAEAFIGALIPLAAKLIPQAAKVIRRVAPKLIRGATRVVRTLRRHPTTRKLVRTVPTIVKNTARDVARKVARGQRVTARSAVRSLAKNTARTLSSPGQCSKALRRCQVLNRRYVTANRALRARLGRR